MSPPSSLPSSRLQQSTTASRSKFNKSSSVYNGSNKSKNKSSAGRKVSTPNSQKPTIQVELEDWDASEIISASSVGLKMPKLTDSLVTARRKSHNSSLGAPLRSCFDNAQNIKSSGLGVLNESTNVDVHADELELLYNLYLQSQLIKSNASINQSALRKRIEHETFVMWRALEEVRSEFISIDKQNKQTRFLLNLKGDLTHAINLLETLLESSNSLIPDCVQNCGELSNALDTLCHRLTIVSDEKTHDINSDDLQKELSSLAKTMVFYPNDDFTDSEGEIPCLKNQIESLMEAITQIGSTINTASDMAIREASLKLSHAKNDVELLGVKNGENSLGLIPPPITEPKLIDI